MNDEIVSQVRQAEVEGAPRYLALRDALLVAIANGRWRPGDKLPTETELTEQLPFSLGTIQKAYGLLAEDGIITRKRGSGSFVAVPRQMPGPLHCRFLSEDGSILPVFPRLLGHRRVRRHRVLQSLLQTDGPLVRIDRLLSVDEEFTVWNRFYAPEASVAPLLDLPRDDLEPANFKALLAGRGGLRISRIVQTVRLGAADPRMPIDPAVAEATALTIEAQAFAPDGTAIYLQELLVPQTRRRLLIDT